MFKAGSVLRQNRNAAEIQHIQNVGKRQFVLQRKRNNVKFRQRVAAFQTVKRNAGRTHLGLHVNPRRTDALAPDALLVIEQTVKNTRAKVRHSDLVGIREAERKPEIYIFLILHPRAPLAADIACRLLYTGQDGFHFFVQAVILQMSIVKFHRVR